VAIVPFDADKSALRALRRNFFNLAARFRFAHVAVRKFRESVASDRRQVDIAQDSCASPTDSPCVSRKLDSAILMVKAAKDRCVYRKLKLGRSNGEARRGSGVIAFFQQKLPAQSASTTTKIETEILHASSTSEFSHSLGQSHHFGGGPVTSRLYPTPDISPRHNN
jgi:hypothetical protein